MYKIMLVDDDYPVLEFLQQAIPWSELGFTLICSTEDSRIALEMATEEMPDLLITDIGMPHLNGIELIRQLKVIKSNLASIILSCHDDFSYAQQAIKLEVMDYIIKESMTPGLVIKVLEKAKQKLDDERASLSKQENADRIYNRSRRSYRVQMAKTLIEAPMIDEEYWCTEFRQLNIDFGERQYVPVCGYIHQYNNHTERFHSEDTFLYAVENILNELLEQHALPSTLRYKKMFFLVLPYDMPHREGLQLEAMLSGLRRSIQQYLKIDFSFIIEDGCRTPTELKSRFLGLLHNVSHLFYRKESSVVRNNAFGRKFLEEDIFKNYHTISSEFRNFILDDSPQEIDQAVQRWMIELRDGYYHPEEVKAFFIKLVQDMEVKLKALSYFQSSYSSERLHQTLLSFDNLQDLEQWFIGFLRRCITEIHQIIQSSKRREILLAQKYVSLHLNKKITLEEVSTYLHLNLSYFSRLYKQETNEGFIEYVTRTKMERAKEELAAGKKTVEEVAYQLGFDNKSYFNKCFRNYTGMSPQEYRLFH